MNQDGARLLKISKLGYEPIYQYISKSGNFIVQVPNRMHFKAGLLDIVNCFDKMTEAQAEEARTMDITGENNGERITVEAFNGWLGKNGFKLTATK